MSIFARSMLVSTILMLVANCLYAKRQSAPPGSFLRYRVSSVTQLAAQIKGDAVVRTRYAKHFNVAPERVAPSFAQNLRLISIPKPMRVTAYYVGRGGNVSTKHKLLPKGSMVFVNREGLPVIAWSCGNPVTRSLPVRPHSSLTRKAQNDPIVPAEDPIQVASAPEDVITPQTEELLVMRPAPPSDVLVPVEPELRSPPVPPTIHEVLATAGARTPIMFIEPPTRGFGTALDALGALIPVAGVVISSRDDGSREPISPVPEPSGLVVLAFGALAGPAVVAVNVRRRSRRVLQ